MGSMTRVMQKIRGEDDPPEETQASTSPEAVAEQTENPPPADSDAPVEVVNEAQMPSDAPPEDTTGSEATETPVDEAATIPDELPAESAAEIPDEASDQMPPDMATEAAAKIADEISDELPAAAMEVPDEMPADMVDEHAVSEEAAMTSAVELQADEPPPASESLDPLGEAPPEETPQAVNVPDMEPEPAATDDTLATLADGMPADEIPAADEMPAEEPPSSFVAEPPPDISKFTTPEPAGDAHPTAPAGADTIEWNPKRVDPVVVAFHDRYSANCEQYRSVRARLLTMNSSRSQQVLAITSSVPEEGKSVSTINLGMVMAEGGEHHILVVDADFRRTSIARMLGIPCKPGLANLLNGEVTLEEAVQPTPFPNLKLLPAGEVRNKAYGDLLGGPAVTAALDECRTAFDYTFVDTPPVTTVSDVCLLAPYCDGAIMIVEMRRTPEPTVQQAVRTLQANNVKVLGCLLSRFRDRGSGYYEHYYSSYYNNR